MSLHIRKIVVLFILSIVMFSSFGQKKNPENVLPLSGRYKIQFDSKVLAKNGGKFFVRFDSSETSIEKFLPRESKDTVLSNGSIGQPRMVEISLISTNDSSVNIFNSYEKNIDPNAIKNYKFYCTPGNNTITLSNNMLTVQTPNQYQRDYMSYETILNSHVAKYINPVLEKYKEAAKVKDSIGMQNLSAEYQHVTSEEFEFGKVDYPFIKNHPQSPVSLYVLALVYRNDHLDTIQYLLNGLAPKIQNLPTAISIKNLIVNAQATAIGKTATEFTIKDTSDKEVSLSDFKGKYVLIDFWASWCGPCRAENPNVVKAFEKFKDKNFTILSISLDDSRNNWLKAVRADRLVWSQLSELKGWEGKVSRAYAVSSIPTNFLVDPNGKIVAKNLRGEDLEGALEKFL